MKKLLVIIMLFISLPVYQLFGQTEKEILMLEQYYSEMLEYQFYFLKRATEATNKSMWHEASSMATFDSFCSHYAHSCEIISTLGRIKLYSSEAHIKEYCEVKISWYLKFTFYDKHYEAVQANIDAYLTAAESKSPSIDNEILEKIKDFQDEVKSLKMLFHLIK